MNHRLSPFLLLFIAGPLLATSPAHADIINSAGDAVVAGPADLRADQTEDSAHIRGMGELTIGAPTEPVDAGEIPSIVTEVQCHILHYDANGPIITATATGDFGFDAPIIALVYTSDNLDVWDDLCQRPGMVYPSLPPGAPGDEPQRGLETSSGGGLVMQDDAVEVYQSPSGLWNRVEFTGDVPAFTDQVRVITCKATTAGAANCAQVANSIGWGAIGTVP